MPEERRTEPAPDLAALAGADPARAVLAGADLGDIMPEVPEAPPSTRLSLFRQGDGLFGIDGESCREVAAIDTWTEVPLVPSYLLGVANLRGNILPLLRIAPLLGHGSRPTPGQVLVIVIEAENLLAGLVVDEVLGFEPYDRKALDPLPDTAPPPLRALGQGLLRRQGGDVMVLSGPRVLDDLKLEMEIAVVGPGARAAPLPVANRPFVS